MPNGTRQCEAEGLVQELLSHKHKHKKNTLVFGVVHPSNLLICPNCLLFCGVSQFLCYLLLYSDLQTRDIHLGDDITWTVQRHLCGLCPLGGSRCQGDLKVV